MMNLTWRIKENWRKIGLVWTVTLILLLIVGYSVQVMYARYRESVSGSGSAEAAMFINKDDLDGELLVELTEMEPGEVQRQAFTVQNYLGSKRSEVTLAYTVSLDWSANLPLTLALYKNGGPTNLLTAENTTADQTLALDIDQQDAWVLEVAWSAEASSEAYADLTDYIDIHVLGRQVD